MKKVILVVLVGIVFLSGCVERVTVGEIINSPKHQRNLRVSFSKVAKEKMRGFCQENHQHPACFNKNQLKKGGNEISKINFARIEKKIDKYFYSRSEGMNVQDDKWTNLPEGKKVFGDCEDRALLLYKMASRYGLKNVHIVYGLMGVNDGVFEGQGHIWIEVNYHDRIVITDQYLTIVILESGEILGLNGELKKIKYKKLGVIRWWLLKIPEKSLRLFIWYFFLSKNIFLLKKNLKILIF